jgi:hypothetical protein
MTIPMPPPILDFLSGSEVAQAEESAGAEGSVSDFDSCEAKNCLFAFFRSDR